MKINKEEFNKLKQLDRIEFRQRLYKIQNDFEFIDFSFLYILLFISLFGFFNAFIMTDNIRYIVYIVLSVRIFLLVFLIQVFLNILYTIIEKKQIEKLEREYFKIDGK